jgi:hypothetical protein
VAVLAAPWLLAEPTLFRKACDQMSDLTGGYADLTVKLPNPMFHLP